jgi:hypothetical protein
VLFDFGGGQRLGGIAFYAAHAVQVLKKALDGSHLARHRGRCIVAVFHLQHVSLDDAAIDLAPIRQLLAKWGAIAGKESRELMQVVAIRRNCIV